jgi:hypothetical protein
MPTNTLKNSTTLYGLELNVLLGWPELERAQPQVLMADIHMQFPTLLKACTLLLQILKSACAYKKNRQFLV